MPRQLGFAIFFAIVLSIIAGIHTYFWMRLVRDTGVQQPWRLGGTALVISLAVLLPVTMIGSRTLPPSSARLLAWVGFSWLGVMLLLFASLLAMDGGLVAKWLAEKLGALPSPDPSRRAWLARMTGGVALSAASAAGAMGVRTVLGPLRIREVDVPLARLPAEREGTVIAQITDLHVGPLIRRQYVEDVVRRTNELRPDIIAVTGDMVDGTPEELAHAVAPLADLKARFGVYFITGNHEYYSGVDAWLRKVKELGMHPLRNERVTIGEDGASFDLAGVDDWTARSSGLPGHAADLPRALAGRDPSRELVLLAHQPRAIKEAAAHGVGLQLSGHTHAGQMWPFSLLVRLVQPYIAGLHRHGDTWIYVSPGTGFWGPPMRVATQSEITKIVLRRA